MRCPIVNALTGAKTYRAANGGSFVGLLTGSDGVTPVQDLGTGLTLTTGASEGPHVISAYEGGHGSYVVLTAFAPGTRRCFGVLYLPVRQLSPVLGKSAPGTYYVMARSGMTCKAATIVPTTMADGLLP